MSVPVILRSFQFFRDFRNIQWWPTLWYNLLRAACSGVILGALIMIVGPTEADRGRALLLPVMYPVMYLIFLLPMGIVCAFLSFVPYVVLFSLFFALSFAIADPLVCVLHRIWPKSVPVESPPLFSLSIIHWVLDAPEISVAD